MPFRFLNNYSAQLGATLASGATAIEVTGDASAFADASPTTPYALTLSERNIRGVDLRREIVHVTGRSGQILTVVRGREGTAADDWPIGTPVEARATAAGFNELAQALTDHEADADPHPQYQHALPGDVVRSIILRSEPLDLTDDTASVTIAAPDGYILCADALEVVVTDADDASGTPEIVAGYGGAEADAYLPATAITVADWYARQSISMVVAEAAGQVVIGVATAGAGTTYTARILVRGFLLEM